MRNHSVYGGRNARETRASYKRNAERGETMQRERTVRVEVATTTEATLRA